MVRSLALVLAMVAALVVAGTWEPEGPGTGERAATASVEVCPAPQAPDALLVLPPGVHDELTAVRDTVAADRGALVEAGAVVSAIRVDPVIRRVRVVVSGALPVAAGYLAHVTDPALVCIEPGGLQP